MEFIKKHWTTLVLIVIIILGVTYFFINQAQNQKEYMALRKEVLAKDSLVKVRDGEFTKLVNDMATKKDLDKIVKEASADAYKDIKGNKEKIINNTGISIRPTTKVRIDTVYVDKNGTRRFTSYYPSIDSSFITHKSVITGNLAENTWEFKPLKLNVVVTQQKDGMYRARLIGPNWIQAEEVTVTSLPMSPMTQKNFKLLLGASGNYSVKEDNFGIGVYAGFRYKDKIILLNGTTNQVVSLGYIQEF